MRLSTQDWAAGTRVTTGYRDLFGAVQEPPDREGRVRVLWDDGEATWSMAHLLRLVPDEERDRGA